MLCLVYCYVYQRCAFIRGNMIRNFFIITLSTVEVFLNNYVDYFGIY